VSFNRRIGFLFYRTRGEYKNIKKIKKIKLNGKFNFKFTAIFNQPNISIFILCIFLSMLIYILVSYILPVAKEYVLVVMLITISVTLFLLGKCVWKNISA